MNRNLAPVLPELRQHRQPRHQGPQDLRTQWEVGGGRECARDGLTDGTQAVNRSQRFRHRQRRRHSACKGERSDVEEIRLWFDAECGRDEKRMEWHSHEVVPSDDAIVDQPPRLDDEEMGIHNMLGRQEQRWKNQVPSSANHHRASLIMPPWDCVGGSDTTFIKPASHFSGICRRARR